MCWRMKDELFLLSSGEYDLFFNRNSEILSWRKLLVLSKQYERWIVHENNFSLWGLPESPFWWMFKNAVKKTAKNCIKKVSIDRVSL